MTYGKAEFMIAHRLRMAALSALALVTVAGASARELVLVRDGL